MKRICKKVICCILGVLICVSLSGCVIGEYAICDFYVDENGDQHFMMFGKRGANGGDEGSENGSLKVLHLTTSHFDHYACEQTDTGYEVRGRVSQENDDKAVAIFIHAEEDATINVSGTLTKVSGNNTELVYEAENGERTKITDNFSDSYDIALDISKGTGKLLFTGESAVYDFEIGLQLIDGVSYSSN